MDITDYKDGSAFIRLPRDVFADKTYYNNLLHFLKLPDDTDVIIIDVNNRYIDDSFKYVKQNFRGN